MEKLQSGQFYGDTNQKLELPGLILTDTEYTHPYVDWHYHEHAYFTFIIAGKVLEANRKETYHCAAGDLLFHHWQEPHYNNKPKGFTRGFHVELKNEWFSRYDLPTNLIEGSVRMKDPRLKLAMSGIFGTMKRGGENVSSSIDTELIGLFTTAAHSPEIKCTDCPNWVKQLSELLHDAPDSQQLQLSEIARIVNVHPVHLSRTFPVYFDCSFSKYIRLIKLQKATQLLADKGQSLTEIAASCGFADQSHFIRHFKAIRQMTPLSWRRLVSTC
jgi:AraC family transcriptional regulator